MVWTFRSKNARDALACCKQFLHAVKANSDIAVDTFASSLIYSELVANVVAHAPGAIDISVAVEGGNAVLKVADEGPGFTLRATLPDDAFAERGRGLFLVSKFAKAVCAGTDERGHHYVKAVLPRSM